MPFAYQLLTLKRPEKDFCSLSSLIQTCTTGFNEIRLHIYFHWTETCAIFQNFANLRSQICSQLHHSCVSAVTDFKPAPAIQIKEVKAIAVLYLLWSSEKGQTSCRLRMRCFKLVHIYQSVNTHLESTCIVLSQLTKMHRKTKVWTLP